MTDVDMNEIRRLEDALLHEKEAELAILEATIAASKRVLSVTQHLQRQQNAERRRDLASLQKRLEKWPTQWTGSDPPATQGPVKQPQPVADAGPEATSGMPLEKKRKADEDKIKQEEKGTVSSSVPLGKKEKVDEEKADEVRIKEKEERTTSSSVPPVKKIKVKSDSGKIKEEEKDVKVKLETEDVKVKLETEHTV